ncbi:MAG: response regulator transcription factor [Thermoleophilia bacterium]|nr:response regulator transcription factor [Thermoleophilia bacterium]
MLVDDHPLILAALERALARASDLAVVGVAQSGREGLAVAERTDPDVVVLDLRMPDLSGLECVAELKRRRPGVRVVMLSAVADPAAIRAALEAGADAYVVKSVNPIDMPSVIRQVVDRDAFTRVVDDGVPGVAGALSERELAVLRALAAGDSNAAIALKLWVSEQTVKFHVRNIFRKLGVSSRTEAARRAHEAGVVAGG